MSSRAVVLCALICLRNLRHIICFGRGINNLSASVYVWKRKWSFPLTVLENKSKRWLANRKIFRRYLIRPKKFFSRQTWPIDVNYITTGVHLPFVPKKRPLKIWIRLWNSIEIVHFGYFSNIWCQFQQW